VFRILIMVKGRTIRSKRFQSARKGRKSIRMMNRPSIPRIFSPSRLVSRLVFDVQTISGDGFLNLSVNVSRLIAQFKDTFAEFKILHVNLEYLPLKAINTDQTNGYITSVLLDGDSTSQTIAWSLNWFKTVSDCVGSKTTRDTQRVKLIWRPTEPEDRNYFPYDSSHAICNLWMIPSYFDTSAKAIERKLTGWIKIDVHMLARITSFKRTFSSMLHSHSKTIAQEDENINDDNSIDINQYAME
jgi:hypothetical protein